MENQPPTTGRPWFRLLSQVRLDSALQPSQPAPSASRPPIQQPPVSLTSPATIPQPQPPPPLPQPPPPPPQTQTQTPSPPLQSPQPQPSAPLSQIPPPPQRATMQPQPSPATQDTTTPPSSSVRTVEPQLVNPPQRDITASRSTTPPQSPRVVKPSSPTPPLSPMVKQLQPLPPAQPTVNPEPEPKPLLRPREPKSTAAPTEAIKEGLNSHSQADLRAPPLTKKNQDKNAALDARGTSKAAASKKEDAELSIITLAGENMGAYMELSPHPYHQHSRKPQGEYSSPGYDDKADTEGKSGDNATKAKATKNKSVSTRVNSNVQSVNNSILFNTSCTAHNPGVHIILNRHRAESQALIPPSKEGNQLHSSTSAANHGH